MRKSTIEIVNFAVGLPKNMYYGKGKQMQTGICKGEVEECFLAKDGFRGDGVADLRNHGGLDRAVCVYPYEHYLLWEQEFGVPLSKSAFGENLTLTNMLENNVHIGDIYRLGEAVIQVTQGRVPCSTITKRTNIPKILKRIIDTGYTGFFCRVLEEGIVSKKSTMTLMESHSKQVSILYGNEIYFHRKEEIEGIKKIMEVEELSNEWQERLTERLEKLV